LKTAGAAPAKNWRQIEWEDDRTIDGRKLGPQTCDDRAKLQAEGFEVMASQHGLDSLATDIATVKAWLTRVGRPAILVGHSYGGTLITHAGTDPRVAGLVYIAALAPDADETSQGQLDKFPTTPVFSHIEVTDARVWLKKSGHGAFLRRPVRSGPKTRVCNAGRARGRPVLAEGRRHGLEVQAVLVCARQPRSNGSP